MLLPVPYVAISVASSYGLRGDTVAQNLRKLKEIVQQRRADVIIGKNGLSEGVLREIDRHLEDKGVVKVKALRSALKATGLDRKELASRVASALGATLLDVRGRTFVLYRPKTGEERREPLGQRYKAQSQGSKISGEKGRWLRRSRFQRIY